jgi:hypothetical protein
MDTGFVDEPYFEIRIPQEVAVKKPKSKAELYKTLRREWTRRPVTRVKQSAKLYSRKWKRENEGHE